MQASFSFFIHSFNRICITAGFNKSSEALLFITASLLQLDIRLNIHLQEECGEKHWHGFQQWFTLPDRLYSRVGKVPLSVWKCPLPAEQKGQPANTLCTCVSAQQFLEGNNLAPVELLVGPVWLLMLAVK